MKIIISHTFEKKFLSKMKRYFSVQEFVDVLKSYKFGIVLKDPYFKMKLKIKQVHFRGVVLLIQDKKVIPVTIYLKKDKKVIPVTIYLKKDKRNGENIIWSEHKKQILFLQEKIAKDLKNKDFKVYE